MLLGVEQRCACAGGTHDDIGVSQRRGYVGIRAASTSVPAAKVARALGLANHIGHLRDIDRRACRQGFDVSDAVWPARKTTTFTAVGNRVKAGVMPAMDTAGVRRFVSAVPSRIPLSSRVWKSNSR